MSKQTGQQTPTPGTQTTPRPGQGGSSPRPTGTPQQGGTKQR